MIIDCHGHYTTEPEKMRQWRLNQLELVIDGDFKPTRAMLSIDDADIRNGIESNQLKLQRERGTDKTIFSPRAVGMGHHLGTPETSMEWTQLSNDMIYRVVSMYPDWLGRTYLGRRYRYYYSQTPSSSQPSTAATASLCAASSTTVPSDKSRSVCNGDRNNLARCLEEYFPKTH